jgi:hypothetical protein
VIEAQGKYICRASSIHIPNLGLEEEIYRIEGDDVNEMTHR